jgi:hypothetical protein
MTAITLALNDPSQWPLLMTCAEVAHVLRRSTDTVYRRVRLGLMPPPGADGLFERAHIEQYCRGKKRVYERAAERGTPRGRVVAHTRKAVGE